MSSEVDGSRDEFLIYLAKRLGVSRDEALVSLGNWLSSFAPSPGGERHAFSIFDDQSSAPDVAKADTEEA